jgi:hypothetical protein
VVDLLVLLDQEASVLGIEDGAANFVAREAVDRRL